MTLRLTILQPNLAGQRYSCHGCGNCCRDFTVQLREEDIDKIRQQGWTEKLGFDPVVEFRGERYLRQRDDGACVFWLDDGRCRIHAEFGLSAKPIACQMFPFSLTPVTGGAVMGINFACQSVLENKGAELRTHTRDLERMARSLPEVHALNRPPMLTDKLRASVGEIKALVNRLDAWFRRDDIDLSTRLDGLAWVIASLGKAKLAGVRDDRFADLLDVLFGALPDELGFHPVDPPTRGQRKMLRQAVFARIEDPKIGRVHRTGRIRTVLSQLRRSRRFASGKGVAPRVGDGWPEGVRLEAAEQVAPANDPNVVTAIDDLLTRWLRATILGGRAWGAGYYGWSALAGLRALVLNVAVLGWLARLHAAGRGGGSGGGGGAERLAIEDVRAALSRIDRTAGRARWLGGVSEEWRSAYFDTDDGLRRLLAAYPLIESE
ncbi:MAG: YkgJ family cysteine cluster protein [Phycisphaeraceae bacterium]|nr:MAG: YkgJ family cysteine cluster protein [Phycisphaeraceae bacterium]